ncbi:uncharacterized protein LOC122032337 [Zingiber officinale]|uniref:uncharacterized protein LOC122032337 n=1 Tax=Zingiber officinale TaxID=94328 RepID=UPI001C4CB760|nr:uncharacterized protein LOC122032337 [Zingiber officinale]XP_042447551.1 uncharacterized protein LOC122032337 [Zingiber officinale]
MTLNPSSTMSDDAAKATGMTAMRQMVQELLQKWQPLAVRPKEDQPKTSGIPPSVDKRLKSLCWDSDEECCHSPEAPPDVPKGYCPVYVGPEQRRFVIPTTYLGLPVFRLLLEKAEEEFGFNHKGVLTIPCEIETFKYILQFMERHAEGLVDDYGGNPTGRAGAEE